MLVTSVNHQWGDCKTNPCNTLDNVGGEVVGWWEGAAGDGDDFYDVEDYGDYDKHEIDDDGPVPREYANIILDQSFVINSPLTESTAELGIEYQCNDIEASANQEEYQL